MCIAKVFAELNFWIIVNFSVGYVFKYSFYIPKFVADR